MNQFDAYTITQSDSGGKITPGIQAAILERLLDYRLTPGDVILFIDSARAIGSVMGGNIDVQPCAALGRYGIIARSAPGTMLHIKYHDGEVAYVDIDHEGGISFCNGPEEKFSMKMDSEIRKVYGVKPRM